MANDEVLRSIVRDDAYRVERVLAKGPSGTTELVTLDGEGPLVRKRIPAALANATAWATVMGLEEPLLPQVEEMYRMPDELVVVCAYVPGDSLRERIAAQGPLDAAQAVAVMRDLCHAAGVLHAHGVVHRDITPGNVILARDGAHLIDLGIARHDRREAARDTHALGTWGFAAPEQFGFAQTDARSDVYTLGRLLGYMLTGVMPDDDSFASVLEDERIVDPTLAAVVTHATAFEPSARYQSTVELADALGVRDKGDEDLAPAGSAAVAASQARTAPVPASTSRSRPDTAPEPDPVSAPAPVPTPSPAPVRTGPRPLRQAPPLPRILSLLVWMASVAWTFLVCGTGIGEVKKGNPNWQIDQYFLALVTVIGVWAISYELYCALTYRGRHAQGNVRLGNVLLQIVWIVLLMAAAFGVEVLVLTVIS